MWWLQRNVVLSERVSPPRALSSKGTEQEVLRGRRQSSQASLEPPTPGGAGKPPLGRPC